MKRFVKFIVTILVLGTVAIASVNGGGNPEVVVSKVNVKPTDTSYCDPYQRFLGLCHTTNDLSKDY